MQTCGRNSMRWPINIRYVASGLRVIRATQIMRDAMNWPKPKPPNSPTYPAGAVPMLEPVKDERRHLPATGYELLLKRALRNRRQLHERRSLVDRADLRIAVDLFDPREHNRFTSTDSHGQLQFRAIATAIAGLPPVARAY